MIRRTIQGVIEQSLFKGKVIIIYGVRQVGKTTLIMAIQQNAAVPFKKKSRGLLAHAGFVSRLQVMLFFAVFDLFKVSIDHVLF